MSSDAIIYAMNSIDIKDLAVVFVCILISLSLHEAMHAFVGHTLGDTTAKDEGRLTLNPLKHIDIYTTVLLPVILIAMGLRPIFAAKPVPFNPDRVKYDEFGAAMIAVAGPATNFGLAGITAIILRLGHFPLNSTITSWLATFCFVNIGFFVFNMIPFPPLDGSRLLYAFAPEPIQRFMKQIEGFGIGGILMFMFLLYPFISPMIQFITQKIVIFLLG